MNAVAKQHVESNIRKLRLKKGMDQRELAERLNVTVAAISKWELGIGTPRLPLAYKLATVLDSSIEEIFFDRVEST